MNAELFFFYVFCCSAVFVYGIGLKQAALRSKTMRHYAGYAVKTAVTAYISVLPVYGITAYLLVPHGVGELFPLFLVMAVLAAVKLYDAALLLCGKQPQPLVFLPLMVVFLAVNESTTLGESYCIASAALLSIFALMPVLFCIRKRLAAAETPKDFKLPAAIFFSAAVLFFALYAWNVSWFNQEIFQ